jgi:hypothetical protein
MRLRVNAIWYINLPIKDTGVTEQQQTKIRLRVFHQPHDLAEAGKAHPVCRAILDSTTSLSTLSHAIRVYLNGSICLPLGAPSWRRPATTDLEALLGQLALRLSEEVVLNLMLIAFFLVT